MKRPYLIAILAICILAVLVLPTRDFLFGPDIEEDEILFPKMIWHINDIDRILIRNADKEWEVVGSKDEWTMPSRDSYPVNFDPVKNLLIGLVQVRKLEAKTSDPMRYAQIDVADISEVGSNAVEVAVFEGSEEIARLLVGKQSVSKTNFGFYELYVRIPGESQAWLVESILSVERNLVEWLDRDIADIDSARVREASIFVGEDQEFRIFKNSTDEEDFQLSNIPDGQEVSFQFKINDIADLLDDIQLEDVKRVADWQSSTRYRIETFDGLIVTARLGVGENQDFAVFEANAAADADAEIKSEAESLSERWKNWAYRLSSARLDILNTKFQDLLQPIRKEE